MTDDSPRPVIGRVLTFAWSLASWVALTALAAALLAALYYYHRVDDELRNLIQQRLSSHYKHHSISLGSASLSDEGIRLRELLIAKPSPTGNGRMELAYAHEITLKCEPTIKELLKGKLTVRAATVKGLTVHAIREIDGSWNLAQLLPFPRFNPNQPKLPTITIEDGTILHSDRASPDRVVKFDNVDVTVQLKRLAAGPNSPQQPISIAYTGSLATSFCRQIRVSGAARTSDGLWTLRGNMSQLDWSPDLVTTLPAKIGGRLESVGSLRADAEIHFDLTKPARNQPLVYQVTGSLSDGKWQPAQLQQPITNLNAKFRVDNQGCEIEKLSATMGDGHISSRLRINGHNLSRPFALSVTAKNQFPITRRLIETLPPSIQSMWQKFQPLGTVSGRLDLSFDGAAMNYDANITCHDVSLLHHTYQYPITNCQGEVRFRNSVLDFSLNGLAGSTPVAMTGHIRNPGPLQTGRWEFKTAGWKTIDDTLINALPPKARDLARRMQVRGKVGFWAWFQRTEPSYDPPQPHLIIKLNEGWVNYDAFPYPVSDIRGTLEWKNGDWSFGNSSAEEPLEGWNDGCRIVCRGNWWATRPDRPLELRFDATNISLDAELRRALSPGAQKTWTSLRPRGTLEQLSVRLVKTDAVPRPSLDVTAIQRPSRRRGNSSASVEFIPSWFPYRLGNVSGHAQWVDGSLIIRRLTAEQGRTTFRTNIRGGVGNDGSWSINMTDFAFDNLRYDDQLARALPKKFAAALNRIKLEGVFSAGGAMHFGQRHPTEPLEAGWDLLLQLERANFEAGLPVKHLFGEVRLEGSSLGDQFSSRGKLNIDSLFCKNIQVTQLKGPIWIDTARIALGRNVPPRDRRGESPPLVGSIYGGRISGDADVLTGADGTFTTRMQLTSANMAALARDLRIGSGNLSGQAYAELILTGSTRGKHTLNGQGTVQLRNANMYELPLVLALLNRISSGKSDNTAFTNSDIGYRVRDGYVYFDRFDLSGDAITLKGKGEMSLQRQLNLDFYTIMGREQFWSPLVRPFLAEAGRQFLQIHVGGTLDNPTTRQEVLPGLNETLQELFPEQDPAAQTNVEEKPPVLSGRRLFFRRTQ